MSDRPPGVAQQDAPGQSAATQPLKSKGLTMKSIAVLAAVAAITFAANAVQSGYTDLRVRIAAAEANSSAGSIAQDGAAPVRVLAGLR